MTKETLEILWVRDPKSMQYTGTEIGYKIHNKFESSGSFTINLIDTYKELYEVTELKIVQDFLNQKQLDKFVVEGWLEPYGVEYIIIGPLTEPSPASVKDAKYISECKHRSKVAMELVRGTAGWVEASFIVKMLLNTLKEKEYELLSTRDLSKFGSLLTLATPDTDDELGISQKFLRLLLDKILEDENFSCEDFFWEQRKLEDGDGYRANVEKEARALAEKYFEPIKKDALNDKIGVIKRASNELSAKFNHFRMFSYYEYMVWIEHCILWGEKE